MHRKPPQGNQQETHYYTTMKTGNTNTINGHEYVDLGLSVKWATCNVGASSPEEPGEYYAWGEIEAKSSCTKENCKTWEKKMDSISGDAAFDAARAEWGGTWRLPTKADFWELENNCSWESTELNGKAGYKITGKNGNSIFLPAGGWRSGTKLESVGSYGSYWSATPDENNNQDAYRLYFSDDGRGTYWSYPRCDGRSVRPVSD